MQAEELVAGESSGSESWVVTRRWAWLSRFFEEVNMSKPNASLTLVIHPENASSPELVKFRLRLGSACSVRDDLVFTPLLQRPRDEFDDLKKSMQSDTYDEDQKQEQEGNEGQGAVNPSVRAERIGVHRRNVGFHNNFLGELFAEDADIQVHIRQPEELAFIDFLIFLYEPDCSKNYQEYRLLDILKMAAQFGGFEACAVSLMHHHPKKDPVIKYLELGKKLPPSLDERMETLAKNFIVNCFLDIASTYDELVRQPLSVIKLVLSSDNVRVSTEDEIHDLVVDWAKHNYPDDLGMRQLTLDTELFHLIRFCHLSLCKFVEVAENQDFNHNLIREAVYDTCLFKARVPYNRFVDRNSEERRERIYNVPVELKVYGPPNEFCSVTMRVTDDEYDRIALRWWEKIRTQPIPFVRRTMAVEISSRRDDVISCSRPNKRMRDPENFDVVLRAMNGGDFPFKLRYDIALRTANLKGGYAVMSQGNCGFECAGKRYVARLFYRYSDLRMDLYLVPWDQV